MTYDQQHPITPPPELVLRWRKQLFNYLDPTAKVAVHELSCLAAQWGADQELDACCDWMSECTVGCSNELRAVRRPKPPSLKKQALEALDDVFNNMSEILYSSYDPPEEIYSDQADIIRRALEALPDDL